MNISVSPSRPVAADTLAFVIGKDELNHLPLSASKTVMDGARACRFNGEAAALFETFVEEGDKTVRVLLVGTGMGSPGDFERAGATISAKLLVSGATHLSVEFPGGASRSEEQNPELQS